jgi:hypothetical protein
LIKETTEAIEEYAREWLENYRYIGPDTYNSFQRSVEDMACLGHVHSIWGIPGVGKSFIAEYIYRTRIKKYADRKSTGEFTMFGWTHVYRPLNLKELASELLQDLQPISFEEKSILRPDDPIEWCRQFLQVNAYCLIVIDGVESTDEWDLIKHAIAFGETCSTFIVTTREENVAKYCATSPELVWNVKCLEAHHAFDLYKDEVCIFLQYSTVPFPPCLSICHAPLYIHFLKLYTTFGCLPSVLNFVHFVTFLLLYYKIILLHDIFIILLGVL